MRLINWKEEIQTIISNVSETGIQTEGDCGWNLTDGSTRTHLGPWLATAPVSGACHEMMENLGLLFLEELWDNIKICRK